MHQKIATCCYCGTRAALVLTGETRHVLACSSCGAPLSRMKHLKSDEAAAAQTHAPRMAAPMPMPARPMKESLKRRKKKSGLRRAKKVFGEVFDLIEDIFD